MKAVISTLILGSLLSFPVKAEIDPSWSEDFPIPENGNSNPYQFSPQTFPEVRTAGRLHAQIYPVTTTGLLPPLKPLKKFIEEKTQDPFRFFIQKLFGGVTSFKNMDDVMRWIGLNPYPQEKDEGVYSVPFPNGQRPDYRIGFTLMERNGAEGFTISCAECHSARLFGKTVLGMTNRFPRANEVFVKAKLGMKFFSPTMFQHYHQATDAETDLTRELKQNVRSISAKVPIVRGLDTSLAQVALSLARRNEDAYATRSEDYEKHPRKDMLDEIPADSKPAVWWNVKYKNRWLSDGSIVSGNPISTNILWNEIGRGADLEQLEGWMVSNEDKIRELTTAVFSSEAPRFTDFFPADKIDLMKAQAGERVFNQSCARCHGHYEKAWSQSDSSSLSKIDLLKTVRVNYPQPTMVRNVGTDPNRYLGMKSLTKLNALSVSQKMGVRIVPQKGYVPPPLVGIWARWPYMHNNSVPSLCALLTASQKRPSAYYAGEANDPEIDFDSTCNGYPVANKVPESWKQREFYFDTTREGMHNTGHDEGIFLKNGKELLTSAQKLELIQYLQTL